RAGPHAAEQDREHVAHAPEPVLPRAPARGLDHRSHLPRATPRHHALNGEYGGCPPTLSTSPAQRGEGWSPRGYGGVPPPSLLHPHSAAKAGPHGGMGVSPMPSTPFFTRRARARS